MGQLLIAKLILSQTRHDEFVQCTITHATGKYREVTHPCLEVSPHSVHRGG